MGPAMYSFEWCGWVQRCMSLIDDSGGVWMWVGGCVGLHVVEEGCQKEHVLLWHSFDDQIPISSVFISHYEL